MTKESKDQRVYFRVAKNFRQQFVAAARANELDPSAAFRLIGRQYIDRVLQEKPDQYYKLLEQVQEEEGTTGSPREVILKQKLGVTNNNRKKGKEAKGGGQPAKLRAVGGKRES